MSDLSSALAMKTAPANELAFEAYLARKRGELDRAALLVEAALVAHRRVVQDSLHRGPLGDDPISCLEAMRAEDRIPCAADWLHLWNRGATT